MYINTFIGLDVHARSVEAFAFNPYTGECSSKSFVYCAADIAEWINTLEQPSKAVYESGCTGFDLAKQLISMDVNCCIGAVSKIPKSREQKIKKNDRADAQFLARMLAMGNIHEVYIPDDECEGARNLVRALDNARDDLTRAKNRMRCFLQTKGYVYNEKTPKGRRKKNWSKGWWTWAYSLKFNSIEDNQTFNYYAKKVKDAEEDKRQLEKLVLLAAEKERWKPVVDGLSNIKGIKTVTAFAIAVEIDDFSRFPNARSVASWVGLVPSEHSSGESIHQGCITKAGNSRLRKLIVESSKCYSRATNYIPRIPKGNESSPAVIRKARKCNRRLKDRRDHFEERNMNKNIATVAIARELIQWCWVIGKYIQEEELVQD